MITDTTKYNEDLISKFTKLESERKTLQNKIQEILNEQLRIQGEYRLLQNLKTEQDVK